MNPVMVGQKEFIVQESEGIYEVSVSLSKCSVYYPKTDMFQ